MPKLFAYPSLWILFTAMRVPWRKRIGIIFRIIGYVRYLGIAKE